MSFLGPLSSSNSQPINYISNGKATDSTLGWVTYSGLPSSRPESGLGGSANVTFTRNTTNPLSGNADFVFTKDAVNRRGQGASFGFILNESDVNKVLTVSFDYTVLSGTYSTGDLTVYLVQDPSAAGSGPVVTQPAGFQIQSITSGNTTRHIATFQLSKGSFPYGDCRLCFHVASTSASAYSLAIDNIVLGPQTVQYGAPVTDTVSFTTSGSWTSNTSYSGKWKRIGEMMAVDVRVSLTGAPNAAALTINLPAGFSIDTSKLNGTTVNDMLQHSSGIAVVGGTFSLPIFAAYSSPTAVAVRTLQQRSTDDIQTDNITNILPGNFASGDFLDVTFMVPILGWSSTVQMSNDTDTRVVAAFLNGLPTGTITGTFNLAKYPTVVSDTHGAYSAATGKYTAPVSGFYDISAQCRINATYATANAAGIAVFIDGSNAISGSQRAWSNATSTLTPNVALNCYFLNAGQTVEIQTFCSGATPTFSNTDNQSFFSVSRRSGPSAIAASETVAASYHLSANQAVTGSVTRINFDSQDFDSHGSVTVGSGWKFTAPISGLYSILGTFVAGTACSLFVYSEAGSAIQRVGAYASNPAGTAGSVVRLLAGEAIHFRAGANTTITGGTLASGATNIIITRVGNYV